MNKPLILAFALLVFAGCGPKSTIKSTNDVRLAGLTQIWTKYQAVNAGEVPKSLDEFKAFAEERGTFAVHEDLESVGDGRQSLDCDLRWRTRTNYGIRT